MHVRAVRVSLGRLLSLQWHLHGEPPAIQLCGDWRHLRRRGVGVRHRAVSLGPRRLLRLERQLHRRDRSRLSSRGRHIPGTRNHMSAGARLSGRPLKRRMHGRHSDPLQFHVGVSAPFFGQQECDRPALFSTQGSTLQLPRSFGLRRAARKRDDLVLVYRAPGVAAAGAAALHSPQHEPGRTALPKQRRGGHEAGYVLRAQ